MSSFGRGFRNRNPLVLVAAVGVTILMLLGFEQLFVTGAWTTVPLKYTLRNKLDSFTYVSWTVGANKRHPPDVPAVYITGGSASRASSACARMRRCSAAHST